MSREDVRGIDDVVSNISNSGNKDNNPARMQLGSAVTNMRNDVYDRHQNEISDVDETRAPRGSGSPTLAGRRGQNRDDCLDTYINGDDDVVSTIGNSGIRDNNPASTQPAPAGTNKRDTLNIKRERVAPDVNEARAPRGGGSPTLTSRRGQNRDDSLDAYSDGNDNVISTIGNSGIRDNNPARTLLAPACTTKRDIQNIKR